MQFLKNYEKCRKSQRYQTCNNRSKKELFSVRTKLIFFRKFISYRNKRTQILMNKPDYLGLSIFEVSKILLYDFWYDYGKSNMEKK